MNEQGSEKAKVRFMMLERGPIAFLHGLRNIARSFFLEASLTSGLVSAAYTRINERVTMLNTLRKRLAVIVGQVSSMTFVFVLLRCDQSSSVEICLIFFMSLFLARILHDYCRPC